MFHLFKPGCSICWFVALNYGVLLHLIAIRICLLSSAHKVSGVVEVEFTCVLYSGLNFVLMHRKNK